VRRIPPQVQFMIQIGIRREVRRINEPSSRVDAKSQSSLTKSRSTAWSKLLPTEPLQLCYDSIAPWEIMCQTWAGYLDLEQASALCKEIDAFYTMMVISCPVFDSDLVVP